MTWYKFLATHRRHPFTGSPMPAPGTWFDASDAAADGHEGIRACTAADLAHWLDAELWDVELAGDLSVEPRSVVAPRARLLHPIGTWTDAVARDLAAASAWRARQVVTDRLATAGSTSEAELLRATTTLDALGEVAATIEHEVPGEWSGPIGLLAEAAGEAVHARVGTAVLTATVAVAGWDEARQDDERRWQSAWIIDRLQLRDD